jgi:hypothetical protein
MVSRRRVCSAQRISAGGYYQPPWDQLELHGVLIVRSRIPILNWNVLVALEQKPPCKSGLSDRPVREDWTPDTFGLIV